MTWTPKLPTSAWPTRLRVVQNPAEPADNQVVRLPRLTRTAALGVALALPVALLSPLTGEAAPHRATSGKAKVVRIVDGDTIDVDRNFDGRIDATIRLLGIDSAERGLCNFAAASKAMKRLVGGKVVRLTSDSGLTGIQNRPLRRVHVKVRGRWVDASEWMLERGWGVWMPGQLETTNALRHHKAADRAAAAGRGWFDNDRCGAGPGAPDALSMQVQYASDIASWVSPAQRLNQEVVRIRNNGAVPLSVDGWTLRVGNDRTRRVPPGGPIPPGQSIDVHVGSGTNTATDRYLGSGTALMYAASLDGGPHLGSGSYLIDPDNDIRASMTWPCTLDCADPTGDDLVISEVVADAPGGMDTKNLNGEYVRITNRGSAPIRTGDIVMESLPVVVEFPGDHWLAPGESVVVRSGKGDSTQDTRYVGADSGLLNSSGDRVLLRTYDAIVVDCYSWGRGPNSTCPRG